MQHLYFPVWISSYSMASITQWLIKQSGCMVSIWVWNLTLKDWHIVSAGLWKQKDSLVTFCSGCAPGDDDTFRGTWKWTQINLQGEGLSILVSQALEDDCKGSQTRHLGKLLCSSSSHLPRGKLLKDVSSLWNRNVLRKTKGPSVSLYSSWGLHPYYLNLLIGKHYGNKWFTEMERGWLKW